jgi:hypothetical protein
MLSTLFSIRALLFGAAVAFAAGSWAGHEVTKWYYQAKTLSAQNRALEDNLRRIREALIQDGKSATVDLKTQEEITRHVDEMVAKAGTGPCLGADDVDRVRDLFNLSR